MKVKSKITCQTNYKAKDLNTDNIAIKTNTNKLAEDKNKKWAHNQYSTSNFLVLRTLLANLASLLVNNFKCQHIYNIIANSNKINLYKFEKIELAKLDPLYK